ncbi:hypothetical protein ABZY11_29890, partial [Streptomyces sp. NPDC006510]
MYGDGPGPNATRPRHFSGISTGSGRAAENVPGTAPAGVAGAGTEAAGAEVEDKHGVPLEVVVVGDCPLDEKLTAQMQA